LIRLVLPISAVETGLPNRKQTGTSDIEEIRSLGFMAVVNIFLHCKYDIYILCDKVCIFGKVQCRSDGPAKKIYASGILDLIRNQPYLYKESCLDSKEYTRFVG
jgi:hypothetical protein